MRRMRRFFPRRMKALRPDRAGILLKTKRACRFPTLSAEKSGKDGARGRSSGTIQNPLTSSVSQPHTRSMAYTVQQAKTHLSRLLKEAEEGKQVVIARGTKPAVRLVPVEAAAAPRRKRVLGKYAGQVQYPDEFFKPLETDEELLEFGFDLLVEDKKQDERVA